MHPEDMKEQLEGNLIGAWVVCWVGLFGYICWEVFASYLWG